MIEIERKGDRIHLRSSRSTPGLGKVVAGASFSRVGGPHWSIPLTLQACRKLREHFGRELRVGTELSTWAREAMAREEQMTALGRSADAELRRVPEVSPVLAKAMAGRTYQRVGARFVAEGRHVLIADEPGLGKTLEAIGGVIEAGVPGPYLVVCPKTAVGSVWAREIPRWWPGTHVVTVPDNRAERDRILDDVLQHYLIHQFNPPAYDISGTWVVVHGEMIRTKKWLECKQCGKRTKWKHGPVEMECLDEPGHEYRPTRANANLIKEHTFPQLFDIEWGAIVVDESQNMLIRPTASPTLVRAGVEELRTRPDGLRIAASGTPFRGKPHLLWCTLNWLRPKEYRGFWRWAETYYEVSTGGWGGSYSIGKALPDKATDLDRELNQIVLRRTKAEVAQDMPPKTYIGTPLIPGDESSPVGVWLPMEPAQRKLYDQMQVQSVVTLGDSQLNAIGVLAELTRLKQFASSAGVFRGGDFYPAAPSNKLNYVIELLEELGYPDDPQAKVVIVSQFTKLLDMFGDELSKHHPARFGSVTKITGQVTGSARSENIRAFNEPVGSASPHIMMLQTKTGGVAITIDSADHMVFLDQTWIVDDQIQAEDRIHRVSNPRPVFYHYLQSTDSIDQHIAAVNAEQGVSSRAVLDERRGIKYSREILERLK